MSRTSRSLRHDAGRRRVALVLARLAVAFLWPRLVTATPKQELPGGRVGEVWKKLFGTQAWELSEQIRIQVPDVAEDGALVPVTVESSYDGTHELYLLAEENPQPLAAHIRFGARAKGFFSLRLKLNETGLLWVVVAKSGATPLARSQKVTVLKGGCG